MSNKCGKYLQEANTNMNETSNVKSQEMFKVDIQNKACSNKSEEYQKSKSRKETQQSQTVNVNDIVEHKREVQRFVKVCLDTPPPEELGKKNNLLLPEIL